MTPFILLGVIDAARRHPGARPAPRSRFLIILVVAKRDAIVVVVGVVVVFVWIAVVLVIRLELVLGVVSRRVVFSLRYIS
jgi:hypothetical protein